MIDINELTLGQLKQLAQSWNNFQPQQPTAQESHPYKIGKAYFVRTVTYHFTGRLAAVFQQELVFDDAAWIPDDGRFSQAVETGNFSEVEPFPKGKPIIVGRGSLIDCFAADWTPPSSQK